MNNSHSLELAKQFLNKKVDLVIDRKKGSKHPKHGFVYEVNYGFIPNVMAPDGEELDAYFLGPETGVKTGQGICIAIIHRLNNDDDKLVVVTDELINISDEEIKKQTNFQEQWFKHEIIRI